MMTLPATGPVIQIRGVTRDYARGDEILRVLKGVNLEIRRGEYVAIMGGSGSGKSSLLNILGCLDRPTTGDYLLVGRNMAQASDEELSRFRGSQLGFVFQSFHLLPHLNVIENILLPLKYQQLDPAAFRARAEALATLVGLAGRFDHLPRQLSGGQQQRVAIARALIHDPELILADEPTGNLDSATGLEILNLFDDLRDLGKTLILVTHSPEVGERSDRTLVMRDGVFVEEIPHTVKPSQGQQKFRALPPARRVSQRGWGVTVADSLHHFASYKVRSLLTAASVVCGVTSVIAMLAVGQGAATQTQQGIAELGSDTILVQSMRPPSDGRQNASAAALASAGGVTRDDVDRLRATLPAIRSSCRIRSRQDVARYENAEVPCEVFGVDPSYIGLTRQKMLQGRFLNDLDNLYRVSVCVISDTLADRLLAFRPILGSTVKLGSSYYRVVGTIEDGKIPGTGESAVVAAFIPLETSFARARQRSAEESGSSAFDLSAVILRVGDLNFVASTNHQVQTAMKLYHRKGDYLVRAPLELMRAAEKSKWLFKMVLGAIGALALLISGIGILNIMLASVSERTREIGIRRSLGAGRPDILRQFLVEAMVLSVGGGLLGVALGLGVSWGVGWGFGIPVQVTFSSVSVAFSVAAGVGVGFGFYPARRAAMLDPIQALRHA